MRLFALFDRTAGQWLTPFFSKTNGTAYRELQQVVQSGGDGNMIAKYPGEFSLHVLGEWEDGDLTAYEKPELLGNVDQVLG